MFSLVLVHQLGGGPWPPRAPLGNPPGVGGTPPQEPPLICTTPVVELTIRFGVSSHVPVVAHIFGTPHTQNLFCFNLELVSFSEALVYTIRVLLMFSVVRVYVCVWRCVCGP